jgi:hypothetical protein
MAHRRQQRYGAIEFGRYHGPAPGIVHVLPAKSLSAWSGNQRSLQARRSSGIAGREPLGIGTAGLIRAQRMRPMPFELTGPQAPYPGDIGRARDGFDLIEAGTDTPDLIDHMDIGAQRVKRAIDELERGLAVEA